MSSIETLDLVELDSPEGVDPLLRRGNLEVIKDVRVRLEVRIGEAELTVGELLALGKQSVVQLTQSIDTPIDLLLDGKVVARGSLVAADDNFGIQISELGF